MTTHNLWVKRFLLEPIRVGTKDVEVRASFALFNVIRTGDIIVFNELVTKRVKALHAYGTFRELLKEIPARRISPGNSEEELLRFFENEYRGKQYYAIMAYELSEI